MRLEIHQNFADHEPVDVAAAYADPGLYAAFDDLPFVGTPELLRHDVGVEMTLVEVRYALHVELPAAALVFVDAARLTFVERARMGSDGSGSFHVTLDHYPRLLRFGGDLRVAPGPDRGTHRIVMGELRVDLGWKGKLVEGEVTRVIAQGLTRALHAQVATVEQYLS